ncbi:MAG: hypothetical protein R2744_02740 [Bacteroidales bacterium]
MSPCGWSDRSNRLERLWLKNEWDEDVQYGLRTRNRDTINLIVERGVHFRRFNKETNIANAQIDVKQLDNKTLAQARKLDLVPQYWKFLSEAAFTFNQAMIRNWSKGGESNIAFTLDLRGPLITPTRRRSYPGVLPVVSNSDIWLQVNMVLQTR